jgi:hypothetical protein
MPGDRPAHRAVRVVTAADYYAEAARRFGPDPRRWAFVCPRCGRVATAAEYAAAGAPQGAVGYSCVGRYDKSGGCAYRGGCAFSLAPIRLDSPFGEPAFELAGGRVASGSGPGT